MNKGKRILANDLIPGDVFHPGEYISDEMEARGIKQIELAKSLGLSKSEMSLIVNGKRNLTVDLALKLEELWGIDAQLWMRLQMGYEIDCRRKKIKEEFQRKKLSIRRKKITKKKLSRA
jgi:addiction module HigA family antidote